jgi:ubiquinone/menaquinone biosynthesis C-methylase UbiE
VGLSERVAEQARTPSGFFGRFIFWVMRHETAAENEATVQLLDLQPTHRVLEIGFGHGRTLATVASLVPDGLVAGVDPSEMMVRRAMSRSGSRIEVRQGQSSNLPFPPANFDRVFSVHTVYFWADPANDLREIRRVLRGGGKLVLAFRAKADALAAGKYPATIYRFRGEDEWERFARDAGFTSVEFRRGRVGKREMTWMIAA